jgi:hypothetical protein
MEYYNMNDECFLLFFFSPWWNWTMIDDDDKSVFSAKAQQNPQLSKPSLLTETKYATTHYYANSYVSIYLLTYTYTLFSK